MRNKRNYLLVAVLGLSLVLAGCAGVENDDSSEVADPHAGHMMTEDTAALEASGFSSKDIMFAQMMIPHHQQAVEMAQLAPSRAESQDVLEIAAEILGEQDPEIEQMKRWLKEAGASTTMDHDMGMDGMLSDAQFEELAAASGAEFDRLFLEGMILHHQGAIEMAQTITGSENAEAKTLGRAIIESQQEQIERMEALLAG